MERRHVAYVVKILMSCWASVVSKTDRKMIPVEMRLFMVDKESASARWVEMQVKRYARKFRNCRQRLLLPWSFMLLLTFLWGGQRAIQKST